MPKRPSFESPLRAVRKALRLSQAEFAKILRVSEPYIQAIELGLRTISDDLAEEVSFRFGVTAKSLKQMKGVPEVCPRSGTPDDSLENSIRSWTRDLAKLEEDNLADTWTTELTARYARLLETATAEGKRMVLQYLFDRWLRRTARDLGLEEGILQQVRRSSAEEETPTMFDVIASSKDWVSHYLETHAHPKSAETVQNTSEVHHLEKL